MSWLKAPSIGRACIPNKEPEDKVSTIKTCSTDIVVAKVTILLLLAIVLSIGSLVSVIVVSSLLDSSSELLLIICLSSRAKIGTLL